MAVQRTPSKAKTPGAKGSRGVWAILLAAGLSTRMADPKPLVRVAGRPLLAHALDALRQSNVDGIVIVLGAAADRVHTEIPFEGERVVVNPDFAEGMSTSIRSGLRATDPRSEAFLIVLGDQPLVRASTLDALLARRVATGARILVPVYRGVRGNPVLLDRSLRTEIESISGDIGCRGIVAAHASEVLEVPLDDPGILIDVDTPEDVRRIEAALARGTPLDSLVQDRA